MSTQIISDRDLSDDLIINQLKKGDQKMLILLQKRNLSTIRAYVTRNQGDQSDAEDLLQESLIIVWEKVRNTDFQLTAKLDTYIFAISKNLWLKTLRKMGRMVSHSFEEDHYSHLADNTPDYSDDNATIVSDFMNKIGETCKQLLTLFYYEKMDMEKIAAQLNFANAQTAKAKKYQCKKKLEELVKAQYSAQDLLQ
ncbi:MAG: sigma-70 family RNA polymerase sigma factor [Bacteroidota bacterium]|nr:sigma-70 family RNA polymerase sigma factor [Bacteroidota bacterium]